MESCPKIPPNNRRHFFPIQAGFKEVGLEVLLPPLHSVCYDTSPAVYCLPAICPSPDVHPVAHRLPLGQHIASRHAASTFPLDVAAFASRSSWTSAQHIRSRCVASSSILSMRPHLLFDCCIAVHILSCCAASASRRPSHRFPSTPHHLLLTRLRLAPLPLVVHRR